MKRSESIVVFFQYVIANFQGAPWHCEELVPLDLYRGVQKCVFFSSQLVAWICLNVFLGFV